MKKKIYQQPRVCVCEVESQVILAASDTNAEKGEFKVQTPITSGDDDDVWEQ